MPENLYLDECLAHDASLDIGEGSPNSHIIRQSRPFHLNINKIDGVETGRVIHVVYYKLQIRNPNLEHGMRVRNVWVGYECTHDGSPHDADAYEVDNSNNAIVRVATGGGQPGAGKNGKDILIRLTADGCGS